MERKSDYMTVQELTENEKYKFWYFKIKECKESGLSVKDFCDKNNIKPSTYYNYQQQHQLYILQMNRYFQFHIYNNHQKNI